MRNENGLDCPLLLQNNIDPLVESHELLNGPVDGQTNKNMNQMSKTQSLTISSEGNVSNASETQNRLTKRHKNAAKPKDNIITNAKHAFELNNSSGTSDDSTFFAKAILACILIAFLAACTLPYHKNVNVISLYGKGLVQIWNRLGNIT